MLLATLVRRSTAGSAPEGPRPATHLLWFCDAMLLFFALPWLLLRVLGVDPALYIGAEIGATMFFLGAYLCVTRPEVLRWRQRSAVLASLGIGAVCVIVLVVLVISGVDRTDRPQGGGLVLALAWRGIADGSTTGLLLGVFPAVVAREMARTAPGRAERWMRLVLSFVMVWTLSAAHHLGFEQYDDRSLVPVEVTTTLAGLPMIVSGNPAGTIVAQAALHVVVVLEGYETDAVVPPQRDLVRDYVPPGVFRPNEVIPGGSFPS